MAVHLLDMFAKYPDVDLGNSTKRPMLGQLAGGLHAWSRAYGREYTEWEDNEDVDGAASAG